MAQVPLYNQRTVDPAKAPNVAMPNTAPRTQAFSGIVEAGKQIVDAGQQVARISMFEDEQHDTDLFLRAEADVKTRAIEHESQQRQRMGARALSAYDDSAQWWDDLKKKEVPAFKTERARQVYERSIDAMRGSSLTRIKAHQDEQSKLSLVEATKANTTAAINFAAAQAGSPDFPKILKETRGKILQNIDILAGTTGKTDADTIATARLETLGTLHKQILQGLYDTDPGAARAYFESNKGEIPGTDHAELTKNIRIGAAKQEAKVDATMLLRKGFTEREALVYAQEKHKDDPYNIADIYEAEVVQTYGREHQVKAQEQRQLADKAEGFFNQRFRVSDIPVAVYEKLDNRTKQAYKDEQTRRAKEARGENADATTDWGLYYNLRREAIANPKAFAERNLFKEFPKLAKSQREQLIDLQGSAAKWAQGQDTTSQKDDETVIRQLNTVFNKWGLGNSDGDRKKKGEFESIARDLINTEQQRLGRKLRDEERQVIIDKLATDGEVTGRFWNSGKKFYESVREGTADKFQASKMKITDVPVSERAKIIESLKRAKVPVTDDAVISLYKKRLGFK